MIWGSNPSPPLLNTKFLNFYVPSFPWIEDVLCTLLSHLTRCRTLLSLLTTFSGATCRPACSATGKKSQWLNQQCNGVKLMWSDLMGTFPTPSRPQCKGNKVQLRFLSLCTCLTTKIWIIITMHISNNNKKWKGFVIKNLSYLMTPGTQSKYPCLVCVGIYLSCIIVILTFSI